MNEAATFPLELSYVMTVSNKATASIPMRENFTFHSYQETKSFTIIAQDGSTSDWNVRLLYEPQLTNWNFAEWTNEKTPVGWATANNTFVTGTLQTYGNPGLAAQMKTSNVLLLNRIASGSLFLGKFSFSLNMNDPNSMTFFGIPFKTSGKILGIEFDAVYSPGSEFINDNERELGSATIELVKYPMPDKENEQFRYHGDKSDGSPHPLNTAEYVAQAKALLGNSAGTAWNGANITVVPNTEWTKVKVLFNYPNGEMPDFTHLHIVFASSAQGDAFKGVSGSTLKIDKIGRAHV
jgi:hypothetical protein